MLLANALVMAGCADFDASQLSADSDTSAKDGEYLTLRISRPGDSGAFRAPFGGPRGDGYVKGNQWSEYLADVDYDYKLEDLCVFVYRSASTTPINSSGSSTPIAHSYYLTADEFEKGTDREDDVHNPGHLIDVFYTKVMVLVPLGEMREDFQIAVVANVGNITGQITTLGQLRDFMAERSFTRNGVSHIVYADCSPEGKKVKISGGPDPYSKFAMGLFEEPRWLTNMETEGTEDAPHSVSVTLERLAARIDFKLSEFPSEKSQKDDARAPIPYDVMGKGSDEPLAKNWVTHVRAVNEVQVPSYLIRRTASTPLVRQGSAEVTYMGEENTDSHGITTNYVIDPYTSDKSACTKTELFYGSALAVTKGIEFTEDERVVSRKAYAPKAGGYVGYGSALAFDEDSENYFVISYTNENSLRTDQMTREYATGVLYRSVFEPATVWRYDINHNVISDQTVALTTDVLSDGTVPDGGYKSDHYGKTFWMIERLVPNPTEADRVYFVADDNYDQDSEGLTTSQGKDKIRKAVELYIADHNDTGWTKPMEYVNGVAYNYYWIRHSNSQGTGHPFSPMEYSIVRNNIYSVSIKSFSGPGAPSTDPAMDNPDRIQPVTYVHKWHPYTVEEVGM